MPALLNDKYEKFAQALAAGKSLADAHRLAGWNAKNPANSGVQLMRRAPEIKDRVQELADEKAKLRTNALQKAMDAVAVDKEWVLRELVDNVKMAKTVKPISDEDGNPTGEYTRINVAAANKALELIGKELGMFIDRQHITLSYEEMLQELYGQPQTTESRAVN